MDPQDALQHTVELENFSLLGQKLLNCYSIHNQITFFTNNYLTDHLICESFMDQLISITFIFCYNLHYAHNWVHAFTELGTMLLHEETYRWQSLY